MKKLYVILTVLFTIFISYAQSTTGYNLLAHYPFQTDGHDATGNYGNAYLQNAVFQNGAVYSNGIYGTNGTEISTPDISAFDFNDFIITIELKPEENSKYLMVLEPLYRTVALYYNHWGDVLDVHINIDDGSLYSVNTNNVLNVNTWYKIGIQYTVSNQIFKVFVNDNLIATDTLPHPLEVPNSPQKQIVNYHGGFGNTFKGYWKNLKIYGRNSADINDNALANSVKIYPTLLDDGFFVENNTGGEVIIEIRDLLGRLKKYVTMRDASRFFSCKELPKGIYTVSIINDRNFLARKIIKK